LNCSCTFLSWLRLKKISVNLDIDTPFYLSNDVHSRKLTCPCIRCTRSFPIISLHRQVNTRKILLRWYFIINRHLVMKKENLWYLYPSAQGRDIFITRIGACIHMMEKHPIPRRVKIYLEKKFSSFSSSEPSLFFYVTERTEELSPVRIGLSLEH
jgi:hypothetical protein